VARISVLGGKTALPLTHRIGPTGSDAEAKSLKPSLSGILFRKRLTWRITESSGLLETYYSEPRDHRQRHAETASAARRIQFFRGFCLWIFVDGPFSAGHEIRAALPSFISSRRVSADDPRGGVSRQCGCVEITIDEGGNIVEQGALCRSPRPGDPTQCLAALENWRFPFFPLRRRRSDSFEAGRCVSLQATVGPIRYPLAGPPLSSQDRINNQQRRSGLRELTVDHSTYMTSDCPCGSSLLTLVFPPIGMPAALTVGLFGLLLRPRVGSGASSNACK